jgi:pyruvate kinase
LIGNKERVNTSYSSLISDCKDGGTIMIDDGLLNFQIKERKFAKDDPSVEFDEMLCQVVVGGYLGENKGINVPGQSISAPCLTKKDIADLEFGMMNGVDYICMSFVREAKDIDVGRDLMRKFIRENEQIRKIVDENRLIPIIAKIERAEGIQNMEEILKIADGAMVARGDLGVEMDFDELPILQKRLIATSSRIGKIDITATQMLQSMVDNPLPTRAEVTDVANAIFDGTDVIMMSNETATGKYPVKAVEVMARIARTADINFNEFTRLSDHSEDYNETNSVSDATALAAASVAKTFKKIKGMY